MALRAKLDGAMSAALAAAWSACSSPGAILTWSVSALLLPLGSLGRPLGLGLGFGDTAPPYTPSVSVVREFPDHAQPGAP